MSGVVPTEMISFASLMSSITDFIEADSVYYTVPFKVYMLSVVDRLANCLYYPLMNSVPVSNPQVIIYQGDRRFMVL